MATSTSNDEERDKATNDVTEIVRKVLLTMSRHEIPVTPENYRLWFDYMVGSNTELTDELDSYMKDGTRLDDQRNRELYEKYYGEAKDRKLIEEVSQATFRILKEALEGVVATGKVTKDYSNRLNDFVSHLEQDELDPVVLRKMIEGVILDTREVERSSAELSLQLEKAKEEANELRGKLEQAEREATRDVLTGLYNRKYLNRALQALHEKYQEDAAPFSVIMLDIDHFKKVNDTYGHKVGDSVLEFVGNTLTGSVKGRDVPARYGGEEFIVLLPATSCQDACKLAEGIRSQVSAKTLKITKTKKTIGVVTISCGAAEIRGDDTVDTVVERADQALYLAKESGRNNVKSEKDLPVESPQEKVAASAG